MNSPRLVPRQTRADAETGPALYLIKNVSTLRATYQIRLNALRAAECRQKLVLKVPPACIFHPTLQALIQATDSLIQREDLP